MPQAWLENLPCKPCRGYPDPARQIPRHGHCTRIQTFPDDIKFVLKNGKNNISASSAYKLVGDAVPPLLAFKIIKKIEKILTEYSL